MEIYEIFYRINGETVFRVSGEKKDIERIASLIIGTLDDEGREFKITKNFCIVIIDHHDIDGLNGNNVLSWTTLFSFDS